MLSDETMPLTYCLFDNSYSGGSWNMALIEQVDAQRRRAEKAEQEVLGFQEKAAISIEQSKQIEALQAEKGKLAEGIGKMVLLAAEASQKMRQKEQKLLELATGIPIIIEEKNRLWAAVESFAAYRKHIYHCEACADDASCEDVDGFWKIAMDQVDALCGKPLPDDAPPGLHAGTKHDQ